MHFRSAVRVEHVNPMKKTETDAIRAKATAMYTLVKIRNDVAMRDHDSLEER